MAKQYPIESKHIELVGFWPEEVVIINRDTNDGPEHPCWRDDAKRPPTLVQSLLDEKQISEIVVRKVPWRNPKTKKVEERVELVIGVDRTVSMREINAKGLAPTRQRIRARCLDKNVTDREIVKMIEAENALRKKDMDPVRKAESAKRMLDFGVPEADILRVQGMKAIESVKRNQGLLALTATAKTAVAEGKIPVTTALTLAKLPAEEIDAKVAEWTAEPASMPSAKAADREVKEQRKAPEERSKKEDGEVGPPSTRALGKVVRALEKSDEAKKASPVADHVADVLAALYSDGPTRGSLPPDVYATLRWIRNGKDAKQIAGLTGLLRSVEKPVAK